MNRIFSYSLVVLQILSFHSGFAGDPPTHRPDPASARQRGIADGRPDGEREGREEGNEDGRREGREDGRLKGFRACEAESRREHYDRGYQEGYREGEIDGRVEGDRRGESDGRSQGDRDGEIDGRQRSDRDAQIAATPPGRARGIEEANRSDAVERGYAQGLVDGDAEARAAAIRVDYPRGRRDYFAEREAEPVQNRDEFSQKQFLGNVELFEESPASGSTGGVQSLGRNPTYRYYNPRGSYSDPTERTAYDGGYRDGYNSGFNSGYDSTFRSVYDREYRDAYQDGCREARRRDYQQDYHRGRSEGRDRGYREAYDRAYRLAYDNYYRSAFRRASDDSYSRHYPHFYDFHFEAARSAAYRARYDALYSEAHERARQIRYAEKYPIYAAEEYARGRADEARDFLERPARLLGAEITETIANGLYEPGEALRVRFKVRNFSDQGLSGRDLRVKIQALNPNGVVISESEAHLVRDLREKSITEVSEALEFRMNESVVNQAQSFIVKLEYSGRTGGEKQVSIVPKFQISSGFTEPPVFQEGIVTPLKFTLKNQSTAETASILNVKLLSDPKKLEIQNPETRLLPLAPGEERVVTFNVIARGTGGQLEVPFALDVTLEGGRRVGLLDETRRVPVLNDYRIEVIQKSGDVRKTGVSRVYYRIKNVNSRLVLRGLQIHARYQSKMVQVIGPNPQYMAPIPKGKNRSFVIPLQTLEDHGGGTLELEVQEDGRTVVIHQANL